MSEHLPHPGSDRWSADRPTWPGDPELSVQAAEPLTSWLDDRLEELEDRYRDFWTQRSLIALLIEYCFGRP